MTRTPAMHPPTYNAMKMPKTTPNPFTTLKAT
jgi:hypothetical protein